MNRNACRNWTVTLSSLFLGLACCVPSLSAAILSVDVNSVRTSAQPDGNPSPTAAGFSAFDAVDSNSVQSQLIAGHNITMTQLGGAAFQTRDRQGVDGANFPNTAVGNLYRDALQADGGTNGQAGMRLDIDGLSANSQYFLTLWLHDVFLNGTSTNVVSITDANTATLLATGPYADSPQVPTDFSTSRWDVTATTNGSGVLSVEMRHAWGAPDTFLGALALNGFEVNVVPEPSSVTMAFWAGVMGMAHLLRRRKSA